MATKKTAKGKKEVPAKQIKSFRDEFIKITGILEASLNDALEFDGGKKSYSTRLRKALQFAIVASRNLKKAISEKRKVM